MNVVHAGTIGFDALLYPEQNSSNMAFIQQQFQNFSTSLTDAGRQFMEGAKAIYEQINNSEAVLLARNAIRAVKGLMNPNVIQPITTYEDFQIAQPVMQRYIMANVNIRQLFFDQRCDGYSDTYVDIDPGKIGEDHYDYRRVMNGIGVETEDDFVFTYYPDELREGDRELNIHEQVDILTTWQVMNMFMQEKKDPTNIYGGKIG